MFCHCSLGFFRAVSLRNIHPLQNVPKTQSGDLGNRLLVLCDDINEKQIISKTEKQKTRSPRQKAEANGLNTYDWKKNLPSRALSSSVLLVIMSGKTKLKLN